MDRRRFLGEMSALAAAIAGCGGGSGSAPGPNIVMVVIDDLNDWVGFLGGHPQVLTPHLDALAARATVFERAYCNAPLCNPSRASAWSGLAVQQTRVFDNQTALRSVNPQAVVLPDHLAAQGYATRLLGKIYHVFPGSNDGPTPPVLPATNQLCSGYPTVPAVGLFDWAPLDVDDEAMPDHAIVGSAIDFLAQASTTTPFLLAVGLLRTHAAWYTPRRWFDLYPAAGVQVPVVPADDLDDLPGAGRSIALQFDFHRCITSQGLWASAVRAYLASISFVDAQVGRLLAALDASAHADRTLVVVWSDNGFHLGEKFHWHKLALWEPATRVPFLVRRPGQSVPARVQAAVSLLDLAPTVLDLCDRPAPYTLAGRSLRPLLDDPTLPWDHPVLITKDEHDHAVRSTRWRAIRYANGDRELYDHEADPGEWRNVAADPAYADVLRSLESYMPA